MDSRGSHGSLLVPIMTKFDDLGDEGKGDLFNNVVIEYLEYSGNTSERQKNAMVNATMKAIMKLY